MLLALLLINLINDRPANALIYFCILKKSIDTDLEKQNLVSIRKIAFTTI